MGLSGKKAIVTGASRGIGMAIAKRLADSGYDVLITGRNMETLKNAVKCDFGRVIPFVWDMADVKAIPGKFEEAVKLLGGLDILVNNAGIFAKANEWNTEALLQMTYEDWRAVMDVNCDALLFNMQAAVKYMIDHGIKGNILNVTSVAAYEPVYGAYGGSKIVASGLTRGWGKQFAPYGITINGIAPGPVATEMNHWHEGDSLKHDRIPYGRFATIDEIADCALYLLSDQARMVCGHVVVLDGGYAIR